MLKINTVWLATLALLVGACGSDYRLMQRSDEGVWLAPPTGTGLVAQPKSPIPDVPQPIGFVVVPSRSVSDTAPNGLRFVRHIYQGRSTLADVQRFYSQQTTAHGWKKLGQQAAGPSVTLWFTKGPERLTVRADRTGNIITNTVWISPHKPLKQPTPDSQG